jgi:hypothetical protein
MTVLVNGENYAIVDKLKKFTHPLSLLTFGVMYEMSLSCYICGFYKLFLKIDITPGKTREF